MRDIDEEISRETYEMLAETIQEVRLLLIDALYTKRRDELRFETIKSVLGVDSKKTKNDIELLRLYSKLVIIDQEKIEELMEMVSAIDSMARLIPVHLRSVYSINFDIVREQTFADAEKKFDREAYIRFLEDDDDE